MGPGEKLQKPRMCPLNRLRLLAPLRVGLPGGNSEGRTAEGCPAQHSALGRQSQEYHGGAASGARVGVLPLCQLFAAMGRLTGLPKH